MMPGRRALGAWITRASHLPLLGSVLYRLNVNAPVVRMMARGHVYSDPNWLIGERFKQKNGGHQSSLCTLRLDPLCHRNVGPSFRPTLLHRAGRACEGSHTCALWNRDAETVKSRVGSAHGPPTGTSRRTARNFPRRW